MAKKRAGCPKHSDRGVIKPNDRDLIKPPEKPTNQDGGGGPEGPIIRKK